MYRIVVFIASTLSTFIVLSCGQQNARVKEIVSIPYPHPLPDSISFIFLSGIVSKDTRDFGSAFSPEGRYFYFSRSENNQSAIYLTVYSGDKWQEPVLFSSVTSEYAEADPAFGPDGKFYFISNRPKDRSDTVPDYDIWFASPDGAGWSAPQNLEAVNSDSSEYYVSFSGNGHLYFASARKGGYGNEDLYVSRWKDHSYTAPENLGPAVNSERSDYDPFIFPGEDKIIFTSTNRGDTFGGGDLYCSTLNDKAGWRAPVHLSKTFNTSSRDYCAYLTPDSKYFFFSSEDDVKWIRSDYLMKELKKFKQ